MTSKLGIRFSFHVAYRLFREKRLIQQKGENVRVNGDGYITYNQM